MEEYKYTDKQLEWLSRKHLNKRIDRQDIYWTLGIAVTCEVWRGKFYISLREGGIRSVCELTQSYINSIQQEFDIATELKKEWEELK